jgi:endoglucanase
MAEASLTTVEQRRQWPGRAAAALLALVAPLSCATGSNLPSEESAGAPPGGASAGTSAPGGAGATATTSGSAGASAGGAATGGAAANAGSAGTGAPADWVDAGPGSAVYRPSPGQPFGNHGFEYPAGTIFPSGSPAELDAVAAGYYDVWKAGYLKTACGGYYVDTGGGTGAGGTDPFTNSEGHGYGMLLAALMAGHDPQAHEIFDGLNKLFLAFPSSLTPHLMSWAIGGGCVPVAGPDSATDGDLDIAYALLVAAKQWPQGSLDGKVDYLAEAKLVIDDVMAAEVNPTTHLTMLGDWVGVYPDEADKKDATRASDFMLDHFHAFQAASGDARWGQTVDSTHDLIATMQQRFAPSSGLLPDFIVATSTSPVPAASGFLEENDGDYSYNSVRVPWRLGTDWLATGDSRSKLALSKINSFIIAATGGDPENIVNGYRLDGSKLGDNAELLFVAPFGVAAMSDAANQAWLDAIWANVSSPDDQGYFDTSVATLCAIVMSGNWWTP